MSGSALMPSPCVWQARSACRRLLWLCLAACVIGPAGSMADVRVLMAFDPAGHRLQRVLPVESPVLAGLPPDSTDSGSAAVAQGGRALAEWLDADGELLRAEYFADPRVVHGPALGPGGTQAGQRVRLEQGAYLLTGPDAAFQLRITLPYSGLPVLEQAVWTVPLVP